MSTEVTPPAGGRREESRTLGGDSDDLLRVLDRWWPGARPRLGDLVATGAVALMCLVDLGSASIYTDAVWTALMSSAFVFPFLWRRTFPARAAAVVVLGHLMQLAVLPQPAAMNIAAPMAMYSVARWSEDPRLRRGFLVVAAVGSLMAGLSWNSDDSSLSTVVYFSIVCFGAAASAWLLGALFRQRESARTETLQKTSALEHSRIQSVRLAAQEERSRIAREMHDVVAHSLSVVVVQSDGATYALDRAAESADPQVMAQAVRSARAALETIGLTARESLADTRRLVGVLRQDGEGAEYAPTGGVDSLDDLLDPLRAAGLEIYVDRYGRARPLSRTADLAAYRVVQESLTNVIKHAGEARVWVSLDYLEAALLVTVRDDGAGVVSPSDGEGHGLVGMRERVLAVGGSLWAGGAPGGGFLVEARIPYDAGSARGADQARSGPAGADYGVIHGNPEPADPEEVR